MTDGQTIEGFEAAPETKRAQIPVRTTPANRNRLAEAAKISGKSLTQEIEQRLENSFKVEDRDGGPATHWLLNLLASEIALVESHTGKTWNADVATWSAVRTRLRTKLDQIRPPFVNTDRISTLSRDLGTLKIRIEALADYLLEVGAIKKKEAKPSVLAELLQGLGTVPALLSPTTSSIPTKRGMFGQAPPGDVLRRLLDLPEEPVAEAEPPQPESAHGRLIGALASIDFELAIDLDDRFSWELQKPNGQPVDPSEYDGIIAAFSLVRKFGEERSAKGIEFLAAFKEDDEAIKAGEQIARQIDETREVMKTREEQF
ncbi:MAG: hypothetical protein AB7G25_09175 [Sphingomonadaceae bacterium]